MTLTIKRHERISKFWNAVRYFGVAGGDRPIVVDVFTGIAEIDGVETTSYEFVSPSGVQASPAAIAAVETYGLRDEESATEEASER